MVDCLLIVSSLLVLAFLRSNANLSLLKLGRAMNPIFLAIPEVVRIKSHFDSYSFLGTTGVGSRRDLTRFGIRAEKLTVRLWFLYGAVSGCGSMWDFARSVFSVDYEEV